MASEFVTHLIDVHDKTESAVLTEMSSYANKQAKVLTAVDAELQEVRDVLDGLRWKTAEDEPCWCRVRINGLHDDECQRARELMKRLQPKER
jgi:hypothetical protein